jgi:hypothetical protein
MHPTRAIGVWIRIFNDNGDLTTNFLFSLELSILVNTSHNFRTIPSIHELHKDIIPSNDLK